MTRQLLDVLCRGEEHHGTLQFVQEYTDSPHTHMTVAYKHPVNGVIATCGLLHHELNKAMYARALEYMEHMVDLEHKMLKRLSRRLEQVQLFRTRHCPTMVSPLALFSDQCLKDLLTTEDDMTHLTVVQEALTYLNSVLRTTFDTSHGQGSFEQSWRAYQTNIALEELIYGHRCPPMTTSSPLSWEHPQSCQKHHQDAGVPGTGILEHCHVRSLLPSSFQLDQGHPQSSLHPAELFIM